MKRKIMMMGVAMMTGFPYAGYAKSGEEGSAQYSWNTPYTPHYGNQAATNPLLDHVSVGVAMSTPDADNAWKLEFAPPKAAYQSDDPMAAKDKRVGLSLKLDF